MPVSLVDWHFLLGKRKNMRIWLSFRSLHTLCLSLPAFGSGEMQRPCKSRPQPASMRAAPAKSERLGDFQPDPTPRFDIVLIAASMLL